MKRFLILVVSAFFIIAGSMNVASAQDCPQDKFVIALPMIKGFEETKLVDMLHQKGKLLEKKTGCVFESENLIFYHGQKILDLLKKEFKEKKADISFMNGIEHGEYLLDGGKDLYMIGVLAMQKSPIEKSCFFVRKGEYQNVADLRGVKWKGVQWLTARLLLYKAGIDESPADFFGSIGFMTDSPVGPLITELKDGEIDVFNSYMHTVWLSGELTRKDSQIEAIGCEPHESHWVFVARAGIPESFLERFKKIMLNSHKDPDFAQLHFAFKMIDGRFIEMDEKIEKINIEYAKLVRANGWKAEELEFLKKYYPDFKEYSDR